MDVSVTCPCCQYGFVASKRVCGTDMKCPSCNQSFHVGVLEGDEPHETSQSSNTGSSISRIIGNILKWSCIVTGAATLVMAVIITVLILIFGHTSGTSSQRQKQEAQQPMTPKQMEADLAQVSQIIFNQNKQTFFDKIHPVGTAKSVTIHQVKIIEWRNGSPSNDPRDIVEIAVRFTLYWEGPITTDGYTKAVATYDMESQRWVGLKVLDTNGVTNSNIDDELGTLATQVGTQILEDKLNQWMDGNNSSQNNNGYYYDNGQ